jgi:hypothetical protein
MGKIKEHLINNLSEDDFNTIQEISDEEERRYQEWLQSDEYIDFVNEQLRESNELFSLNDIKNALDWAKSAINVEPTDIGKDVYDILFIEKVEEHLNKIRYDKF